MLPEADLEAGTGLRSLGPWSRPVFLILSISAHILPLNSNRTDFHHVLYFSVSLEVFSED